MEKKERNKRPRSRHSVGSGQEMKDRGETYVDAAMYPDLDIPPSEFTTDFDRADYIHRVVTAWDSGVMPERATLALLGTWREIFDQFPVPLSPAYHALRMVFDWPPVPVPPNTAVAELRYQRLDRLEGRPADPCEDEV
jgi:hypothetical protein